MDDIAKLPRYIVEKLTIVDDHWIWTGGTTSKIRDDPKGRVRFQGKIMYPHRVIFFLLRGFDIDNPYLQINHKRECPHSLCCNPNCLYVGTQLENVRDSIVLGHNKELNKTNCKNCGSRYKTSPTTGHRYCSRCKNTRRKLWRLENK